MTSIPAVQDSFSHVEKLITDQTQEFSFSRLQNLALVEPLLDAFESTEHLISIAASLSAKLSSQKSLIDSYLTKFWTHCLLTDSQKMDFMNSGVSGLKLQSKEFIIASTSARTYCLLNDGEFRVVDVLIK